LPMFVNATELPSFSQVTRATDPPWLGLWPDLRCAMPSRLRGMRAANRRQREQSDLIDVFILNGVGIWTR
jgi:hypothetical protein